MAVQTLKGCERGMGAESPSPDAVVVGGGIVGVCAALQLQRTGRRVVLLERNGLAEEASGYNGGVFAVDCLPTGMPSVIRSLPRLLRDPLSPLAIRWRYLPRLAPWLIRFALAIRALTASFTARGGQLRRAEVTGFALADHRVDAVETSEGPISTGAVVVCAGPWSGKLARRLGVRVPLDVERGYGVDLPAAGITPSCPLLLADFRISMSSHRGGLRIVGLDELAAVPAPPRPELAQRILRAARLAFPQVRTTGAITWMRQRPSMPDSLPVIGRAPARHNAYLAFGHGHKGLSTAAITGKLIQQLMDGQPTTIDLAPFRPTRFRFGDARGGPRHAH